MPQPPDIADWILQRCRELGFARAGIARAEPTRYEKELRDWLAAGRHGEMEYLRRHEELLIDPARLVPGAKSIICVADRYGGEEKARRHEGTEARREEGTGARREEGKRTHRVV